MMSPPSLPPGFNWANFIRGLAMLDSFLSETLSRLEQAKRIKDTKEIERLEGKEEEQTEALMTFLAKAYQDTDGAIAKLPQFDPTNPLYIKLVLKDNGQILWLKVEYRVQQIHDRIRQVLSPLEE